MQRISMIMVIQLISPLKLIMSTTSSEYVTFAIASYAPIEMDHVRVFAISAKEHKNYFYRCLRTVATGLM